MRRLAAVIRRPEGIFALSLGPTDDPDRPYTEYFTPLSYVDESLCPWREKDVAAWRSLATVPNMSPRAGMAIIRAVIGSVSDPEAVVGALPEVSFADGPVDLRPYLCHPEHEAELLNALAGLLREISGDFEFPDWHWVRRQEIVAMPTEFRRLFLWGLHLSPWDQVVATVDAYEEMSLANDPDLRRSVAHLLSLADKARGLEWCQQLQRLPADDRRPAVAWILDSESYGTQPEDTLKSLAIPNLRKSG